MPSKGQLSRVDLLELLVKSDAQGSQFLATQMGLSRAVKLSGTDADSSESGVGETVAIDQGISTNSDPTIINPILPREPFWLCVEREQLTALELPAPDKKVLTKEQVWPGRPEKPPSWLPLASFCDVLPRLLSELNTSSSSHTLDVGPVVKAISRGQHLRHLPKKQRRTLNKHTHFIDDRQIHLTTFWRDHQLIQGGLSHLLPEVACSSSVLTDGADQPRSRVDRQLQVWRLPPSGSNVLILSDLGALSTQSPLLVITWLSIIEQLRRRQCNVVALVPCTPDECDARFKTLVTIIPWEPTHHFPSLECDQKVSQCETLLRLLAPALRLEPGLIRQMRQGYCQLYPNSPMPARTEAQLWQHAAIAEHHSDAASWHAEMRLAYLDKFADLGEEEKSFALAIIKQWRGRLSEQVWFEEIIELDEAAQALIADDVASAISYFQQMDADYQHDSEKLKSIDQAWLRRMLQRLPAHVFETGLLGACFQRFKYDLYDGELPEGIDPRNLHPTSLPLKQVELCWHGQTLCLLPFTPQQPRPLGFSPLALLSLRHPLVRIEQGGQSLAEMRFGNDAAVSLPAGSKFEVVTDCERLVFEPWYRPEMVDLAGQDSFGVYVDMLLPSPESISQEERDLVTQRFRYIPPQTFLMGSPKNELSRGSDETQHEVKLTSGYWLADTVVTQALWETITSENPSNFRGKKRPVEKVSWDDVQDFINQLKKQWPLLEVRLPSEAEWECACRGGTTTEFSFGGRGDLTLDKVNYSGKWNELVSDGETKNVKSLPANSLGLYAMHGNVLEWCQDWYGDYPAGLLNEHARFKPEQMDGKNEPNVSRATSINQGAIKILKDGYGFITTEEGDVFFHANNLVGIEYDVLEEGMVLSFEMGEGRNGKEQAVDVELIEEMEVSEAMRQCVVRGGSWLNSGIDSRSAARSQFTSFQRFDRLGFRLALDHPILADYPSKKSNLERLDFGAINSEDKEFERATLVEFDFEEEGLEGRNFAESNLLKVNFRRTDLPGSYFREANLVRVRFEELNLEGVYFGRANLKEVTFTAVNLEGGYFGGANIEESNFEASNLEGVYFGGANLKGVSFIAVDLEGVHFGDANIEEADFEALNLEGCVFGGANIKEVNFTRANLQGANFEGTNLQGANFRGANLQGANFEGANLGETHFVGASLEGADLRYTELGGADFSDANLEGADIAGANIEGSNFRGTCFERIHYD